VSRYSTLGIATIFSAFIGIAAAAPPAVHELIGRAMAAAPDAQHGQILYLKRCTSCHGKKGWGNGVKEIPALAGQRELYLVGQLAEFELLERNGSAMHRATSPTDVGHPQAIPALAGQHYPYTLLQLKNFAAGHRGQVEPPVIDFTAGLSAQDQNGIADYLSRLEPNGS
jgi:cytochrome c553